MVLIELSHKGSAKVMYSVVFGVEVVTGKKGPPKIDADLVQLWR